MNNNNNNNNNNNKMMAIIIKIININIQELVLLAFSGCHLQHRISAFKLHMFFSSITRCIMEKDFKQMFTYPFFFGWLNLLV